MSHISERNEYSSSNASIIEARNNNANSSYMSERKGGNPGKRELSIVGDFEEEYYQNKTKYPHSGLYS
jgi:hypothetical protein